MKSEERRTRGGAHGVTRPTNESVNVRGAVVVGRAVLCTPFHLIRHSCFVISKMTRTPITLVTGPLGSGKTTLLRHILATHLAKIAIVMNEFGEIAIDTKVVQGKNVRIAELGGGCVCCSLLGEFEAAVNEIIQRVAPHIIIVETTGLAEPEAL